MLFATMKHLTLTTMGGDSHQKSNLAYQNCHRSYALSLSALIFFCRCHLQDAITSVRSSYLLPRFATLKLRHPMYNPQAYGRAYPLLCWCVFLRAGSIVLGLALTFAI